MINNIIFLKPILVHCDWGKNDFAQFGYKEEGKDAGELILLSDVEDYTNQIINSTSIYDDISFLYKHNKNFFKNQSTSIPVIIKIINPKYDLNLMMSIDQKNFKYYLANHKSVVQNKFWISLTKENNNIVYNHNLQSKNKINKFFNEFNLSVFNEVQLSYLDSISVPSNIVNGIKKGNIIYEISCKNGFEVDLNYIFTKGLEKYEFDYLSDALTKSINDEPKIINWENQKLIASNRYFKTKIINHVGLEYYNFKDGAITHVFIIEGEGKVDSYNVSIGSNFIVKNNVNIQFLGAFKMIVTHIFDK